MKEFTAGMSYETVCGAILVRGDCLEWLRALPPRSLHAVVTDPPYGVREYEPRHDRSGSSGGVWRQPMRLNGKQRSPAPRFTMSPREVEAVATFFEGWARALLPAMVPGAHAIVASTTALSPTAFSAIARGGLEYRGQVVRLVRTMRGGDRPKGAEAEFPGVCTTPRSCHEPWGIFRAPMLKGMTVASCLRVYGTGALRRMPDGTPLPDVIASGRTPKAERAVAPHPSLKPQAFMRTIVRASLPLGQGVVADPFMGGGSTVAAAAALGLPCVGVERDPAYFKMAVAAVTALNMGP